MFEYIISLVISFIFYVLYKLIVVKGTKKTYIFYGIIELILVVLFLKMKSFEIEYLIVIVTFQIIFLIFIKKYSENTERNKIFDVVAGSEFTLITFNGINDLKSSVYREIEFIIDKMIAGDYGFEGKIYLFISYENKKLDIRYIFSKSQDCKKYLNKKDIMNSNLLEIKYIGNGASIEYVCDI